MVQSHWLVTLSRAAIPSAVILLLLVLTDLSYTGKDFWHYLFHGLIFAGVYWFFSKFFPFKN